MNGVRILNLVTCCALFWVLLSGTRGVAAEEPQPPDPADEAALEQAQELSRATRWTAQTVMPAVVKVESVIRPPEIERPETPRRPNPFEGTPWEDFFPDDFFEGFPRQPDQPMRRGMGSGVIIDPEGIILTSSHIVDEADQVTVELADGRQFEVVDIHTDLLTDLAVLRVQAEAPLPVARLGDSDELEIGEWVIAVGNPFGLAHTASMGIISGTERTLAAGRRAGRAMFLQTDAAINPGNSGGPLVTLDGRVVGINSAIVTRTGGFQGVGFAVPINLAKWVSEQLIEEGVVRRAYLGVAIDEVTPELAGQLGVPAGEGVLINEVFPDTPAAEAGLEPGDVIVSFAGQRVTEPRELQEVVERLPLDTSQEMQIVRDGEPRTLEVVVRSLPEDFGRRLPPSPGPTPPEEEQQFEEMGIEVSDMTAQQAEQLGYAGFEGALITGVAPASPAAEAGLREGMLILRVGPTPVTSVAELDEALADVSLEDGVLLLVRTQAGNRFVVVRN